MSPRSLTNLRHVGALLLSSILLASCADDPPTKPATDMGLDSASDQKDENKDEAFVAELRPQGQSSGFEADQDVELVSGIQGRYHIDVAIFVDKLPEEPDGIARSRLRDPETGQRFGGTTAEVFAESWQSLDRGFSYSLPPIVIDGFEYPEDMIDQSFQFEFSLTMDDGATYNETLELRLVDNVDEPGF